MRVFVFYDTINIDGFVVSQPYKQLDLKACAVFGVDLRNLRVMLLHSILEATRSNDNDMISLHERFF